MLKLLFGTYHLQRCDQDLCWNFCLPWPNLVGPKLSKRKIGLNYVRFFVRHDSIGPRAPTHGGGASPIKILVPARAHKLRLLISAQCSYYPHMIPLIHPSGPSSLPHPLAKAVSLQGGLVYIRRVLQRFRIRSQNWYASRVTSLLHPGRRRFPP